ncbi:hypothetical protein [Lichenibacterium ramalinae]|uniref:PilZ domain-containing protein n=1 Tax=Lichenibacterium ramalinae TaxID=2316527 RepID=A0A4Q2R9Z7_9HYPH|nr:hypothetical protein [Lichenibacterium ramalinae]RYB03035.1 hypothetical protein D3272_18345 [Lichenibacterium ramalinae]
MTRPPVVAAHKIGTAGASHDGFTYAVIAEPAGTGDRRAAVRRRTRLRSGKVMGADGQFVVECLLANRSSQGGLLRLSTALALPDDILVYDDQSGDLLAATIIWRRDRDFGFRFATTERTPRFQAIADNMRRKYYAVRG